MTESKMDPAFKAWLDTNPKFLPIDQYPGGDALLRFENGLDGDLLGHRAEDGAWIIFDDGIPHRLDGSDDEWGRHGPTHFCPITPEAAIHYFVY